MKRAEAIIAASTGLVVVALGVCWEVWATDKVTFFFSKPTQIFLALYRSFASGNALLDVWATFYATVVGLLIGLAAGVSIGLTALFWKSAQPTISTLVATFAALPILAIAPMFMLWFGTGLALKVSLAAIMSLFIVATATFRATDLAGEELMTVARANRWIPRLVTTKILWPMGAIEVLRRLPDCSNAAFLGAFVGEFVAADRGVGYRILRAGSLYQVDIVLAYATLAMLVLLAIQTLAWAARREITQLVESSTIHTDIPNRLLRH